MRTAQVRQAGGAASQHQPSIHSLCEMQTRTASRNQGETSKDQLKWDGCKSVQGFRREAGPSCSISVAACGVVCWDRELECWSPWKMHVFVCFWGSPNRLTGPLTAYKALEAETCSPNQILGQTFCTNTTEPQLTVFIQGGDSQKIAFQMSHEFVLCVSKYLNLFLSGELLFTGS